MKEKWKVVITLIVNSRGVDFDAWKGFLSGQHRVDPEEVLLDPRGERLHVHLLMGSAGAQYGAEKALTDAFTALRRSFRQMTFKPDVQDLLHSVSVTLWEPERAFSE